MYLLINDSIIPAFIALVKKDKILAVVKRKKTESILFEIVKITKKSDFNWNYLKGIIIFSDSTSFTQTRLIITIANVFGEFFNISRSFTITKENIKLEKLINQGIKKLKNKLIFPVYSKKPNITNRK
ncbi:MAG: hypothetical protein KGZ97_11950 [Bacteroidetes bacterium]|nr:hypothetical protein [Bacteroidota bacterium]